MIFRTCFLASLIGLTVVSVAQAKEPKKSSWIAWKPDMNAALAAAKAENKIVMICINAKYVDGRKTEERANKGLREVIYRNDRVIEKSREFACMLIKPASGKDDYAELRLLGIAGEIVSPQHIFVHPNGKTILLRRPYWSHGAGEKGIEAMLAMMTKAQEALAEVGADTGDDATSGGDAGDVTPPGDDRAAWIAERLTEVTGSDKKIRNRAMKTLLGADRDGDCVTALAGLLAEHTKNPDLLVVLIRALGLDGKFGAALPISSLLAHKEDDVRGNAAVSLEYIGSRNKKVVSALLRAATKEKNEDIANHMYRAAGRCGMEETKVRSTLLKKCGSAKTEFGSYGPAIGLAYFEGDKKAARGVEKILKKIGLPGGRRGGGGNTVKRGVVCWTLACVGDEKSGKFMRETLIAKLDNMKAFWVGPLRTFYKTVAEKCEGDKAAMGEIERGVAGFVGFAMGANAKKYEVEARPLMDKYRRDRPAQSFTPRGDGLLGR